MSDVKVSVIMPVYNEEKYLSYAIDSILAQTYSAWELIIVNDASTDRTEEIVKKYTDPRIRYFTYEENKGNPYAQNLGMRESKGEYILALAGDDIAYPNMLKSQVEYLDSHPECIHVQGATDLIDENGKLIRTVDSLYKTDIEIRTYELYGNCVPGGASMFRRTAIDEYGLQYDLEAIVSQDYLFWIDMLPYGEFACIDEVVYQYRNVYGSKAHKYIEKNREWYDDLMRKIFMHAWTQRGYNLDEADIRFIHDYLFHKRQLQRLSHILQGIKTYVKVKNQSKRLELKEKELIPRFFMRECKVLCRNYLFDNRLANAFMKMLKKNDVY